LLVVVVVHMRAQRTDRLPVVVVHADSTIQDAGLRVATVC